MTVDSEFSGTLIVVNATSLTHPMQKELSEYLYYQLSSVPNIHIYGPAPSNTVRRAALCSFNVDNIHPTDIATFLDEQVSKVKVVTCLRLIIYTNQHIMFLSAWSGCSFRTPLCSASTPSLRRQCKCAC